MVDTLLFICVSNMDKLFAKAFSIRGIIMSPLCSWWTPVNSSLDLCIKGKRDKMKWPCLNDMKSV